MPDIVLKVLGYVCLIFLWFYAAKAQTPDLIEAQFQKGLYGGLTIGLLARNYSGGGSALRSIPCSLKFGSGLHDGGQVVYKFGHGFRLNEALLYQKLAEDPFLQGGDDPKDSEALRRGKLGAGYTA